MFEAVSGLIGGWGKVGQPAPDAVGSDYRALLRGYLKSEPDIYKADAAYMPQYARLNSDMASASYEQMMQALSGGSSGQLLNLLNSKAQSDLALGSSMDPGLAALVSQTSRTGQAARGLGFGPGDVIQESMDMARFGNELEQQRKGFATQVAGMQSNAMTLPALQAALGIVSGAGPKLAGPGLTGSMLSQIYQGNLNAKTATEANRMGMVQAAEQGGIASL
jgi:hypothetical protein